MRICLYADSALPVIGGKEYVVDALARQFTIQGHDVAVLTTQPPRSLTASDHQLPYRVIRHPRFVSTRYFVSWYGHFLRRLHHRWKFDVLHCHGVYREGYIGAVCRDRLQVPLVITSHGGDIQESSRLLRKPKVVSRCISALETADALVAISRFTQGNYERLSTRTKAIVSIPNGVDAAKWATTVDRPNGLPPALQSKEFFLFLGRLVHYKGVDLLLEALAIMDPSHSLPIAIAGDGPERSTLEAQALRLGVADRVHFLGSVHGDLKSYLLQNARCTLMPSRGSEAFGLVVLESYAAGSPVIATNLPGLSDLIVEGRTGWLVPPETPSALARAMEQLISRPNDVHGSRPLAWQFASDHRWERIAQLHLDLYDNLRHASALKTA